MQPAHIFHFFAAAHHHGHALVQAFGLDVEHIGGGIGGRAAGLLENQAQGVGFIHQAQLAGLGRVACVLRIHKHAAAHQGAVDFGHHRGHPAHIIIFGARPGVAGEQFGDVLLHRRIPVALVRHIDGEFFGLCGHLRVGAGLHELAVFIKGKHKHAVLEGKHELGLRAVEHIAAGGLVAAFLQKRFGGKRALRLGENGENGAHGNIHIDIGRAVERVKQHQIAAFFVAGHECVFFFAGEPGHIGIGFERGNQHVVGNHIELFLIFALHIAAAGFTQHAGQCTQAHLPVDLHAGIDHGLEHAAQLVGQGVLLQVLGQEFGQGSHKFLALVGIG